VPVIKSTLTGERPSPHSGSSCLDDFIQYSSFGLFRVLLRVPQLVCQPPEGTEKSVKLLDFLKLFHLQSKNLTVKFGDLFSKLCELI
jgi:hypothetical protein